MHDEHNQRPDSAAESKDRIVESAVLAILIECHPEQLTVPELIGEMSVGTDKRSGGDEEVERAVAGLLAVGLLYRCETRVVPTAAALRVAELELGF